MTAPEPERQEETTSMMSLLENYVVVVPALIALVGAMIFLVVDSIVAYWNHSLEERRFVTETIAVSIKEATNEVEAKKRLLLLLEAGVFNNEKRIGDAIDKLGAP